MNQNTLLTFDEWSLRGYRINKGAKAIVDTDGVKKFDYTQVHKPHTPYDTTCGYRHQPAQSSRDTEPKTVYFADGSGYQAGSGPAGPLYFDKFGNT